MTRIIKQLYNKVRLASKVQVSVTNKAFYYLLSIKDSVWIQLVLLSLHPPHAKVQL